MAKIPGGYYLKARCIQESKIAKAPPYVREIWDWLLKEANHKDTRVCKRGQTVRTFNDIQEGLAWYVGWRKNSYSKDQCEKGMKWLRKATMIATEKTTRGLVITVLNYDKFQDPSNYENNNESHTKATEVQQTSDTINKNVKNDKNDKNVNTSSEKVRTRDNKFEQVDLDMANLLKDLILQNTPTFKAPPNLEAWANEFRLMREQDNRTTVQIDYVIRWSQQDNFWKSNILSANAVRRQFDKLVAKIKSTKDKGGLKIGSIT